MANFFNIIVCYFGEVQTYHSPPYSSQRFHKLAALFKRSLNTPLFYIRNGPSKIDKIRIFLQNKHLRPFESKNACTRSRVQALESQR